MFRYALLSTNGDSNGQRTAYRDVHVARIGREPGGGAKRS